MTRKPKSLRRKLDFAVRVVATVVLLAGIAIAEVAALRRPKRKRVEPAIVAEPAEREPTTVDELVNTVSTAGPVTLSPGSGMLN
jgi:hypothetical protein